MNLQDRVLVTKVKYSEIPMFFPQESLLGTASTLAMVVLTCTLKPLNLV
jgi:hypothetical protein